MQKKTLLCFLLLLSFSISAFSQTDSAVYCKAASRENRNSLHRKIIQYSITGNLSLPLNETTEENWMDAFGAMELVRYKSPWADGKIHIAFDSLEKRSAGFQRALVELAYTLYPNTFIKPVGSLLKKCDDAKVFAMAAEYLKFSSENPFAGINLESRRQQLAKTEKDEAILHQLIQRVQPSLAAAKNILSAGFPLKELLPNHTILYSFQRKNRNYPGIAVIRDSAGNFIKDEMGTIFSVPQLARSINNLPGYLTNGNTPQGIFRMFGLDTSKSSFIGPTANIQLTMPFETSLQHFFNDSTITDSVWTEDWYKKLLPATLRNYQPIYESFYAGKAGRTEIIAHGTTVDPQYYSGEPYFPQTPTAGCLCTKETWSDADGKRLESDQQKLVNALQMAGGANGYCVVIEIDDAQKPVTLLEILSLLKVLAHK
ncbi:MAG: hypothetical protein JWP81_1528 [Ferruginibacter sp.]|nr:hypothetical protein [Ferruginibacter sp.]